MRVSCEISLTDSVAKVDLTEVVQSLQQAEQEIEQELQRISEISEERKERVRKLREDLAGVRAEILRCSRERQRALLGRDTQGALGFSAYVRRLLDDVERLEKQLGGSEKELVRAIEREEVAVGELQVARGERAKVELNQEVTVEERIPDEESEPSTE